MKTTRMKTTAGRREFVKAAGTGMAALGVLSVLGAPVLPPRRRSRCAGLADWR